MTPQEQQQRAAPVISELASIVSRYKSGPAATNFKNRVTSLVNALAWNHEKVRNGRRKPKKLRARH